MCQCHLSSVNILLKHLMLLKCSNIEDLPMWQKTRVWFWAERGCSIDNRTFSGFGGKKKHWQQKVNFVSYHRSHQSQAREVCTTVWAPFDRWISRYLSSASGPHPVPSKRKNHHKVVLCGWWLAKHLSIRRQRGGFVCGFWNLFCPTDSQRVIYQLSLSMNQKRLAPMTNVTNKSIKVCSKATKAMGFCMVFCCDRSRSKK